MRSKIRRWQRGLLALLSAMLITACTSTGIMETVPEVQTVAKIEDTTENDTEATEIETTEAVKTEPETVETTTAFVETETEADKEENESTEEEAETSEMEATAVDDTTTSVETTAVFAETENTETIMTSTETAIAETTTEAIPVETTTEAAVSRVPVIYLTTDGGVEVTSKEDYITGTFTLDPGASGYEAIETCAIEIRGRGHSTWNWDKKPYQIKFSSKTSLMGRDASKKWVLLANYADKSLMRNHIGLYMASLLGMPYTATSNFVEVYMNGEYEGVYSIGEKVEVKSERIDLPSGTTADTTGYLIEVGGYEAGDEEFAFTVGKIRSAEVKYPENEDITAEQKQYIKEYITQTDAAIRNLDGYEEYIDVDSFVDWLLVMELSCNVDAIYRRSCFMYLTPGGKLCMGPVWDFDLSFGDFAGDNYPYDGWACIGGTDTYVKENWMNALLTDEAFTNRLKTRWQEVGASLIAGVQAEINASQELLQEAAKRNFTRWDITAQTWEYERQQVLALVTYDAQIDYLRQFISKRAAWLDQAVEELPLKKEDS